MIVELMFGYRQVSYNVIRDINWNTTKALEKTKIFCRALEKLNFSGYTKMYWKFIKNVYLGVSLKVLLFIILVNFRKWGSKFSLIPPLLSPEKFQLWRLLLMVARWRRIPLAPSPPQKTLTFDNLKVKSNRRRLKN